MLKVQLTQALGARAHTEGNKNIAAGSSAHAEGGYNIVTGSYSHVEGENNLVTGGAAHAEGEQNKITSQMGHAEGGFNIVSGEQAHAEGNNNIVSGSYSHAQNLKNIASGHAATAIGSGTIADGSQALSFGTDSLAMGLNSIAGLTNKVVVWTGEEIGKGFGSEIHMHKLPDIITNWVHYETPEGSLETMRHYPYIPYTFKFVDNNGNIVLVNKPQIIFYKHIASTLEKDYYLFRNFEKTINGDLKLIEIFQGGALGNNSICLASSETNYPSFSTKDNSITLGIGNRNFGHLSTLGGYRNYLGYDSNNTFIYGNYNKGENLRSCIVIGHNNKLGITQDYTMTPTDSYSSLTGVIVIGQNIDCSINNSVNSYINNKIFIGNNLKPGESNNMGTTLTVGHYNDPFIGDSAFAVGAGTANARKTALWVTNDGAVLIDHVDESKQNSVATVQLVERHSASIGETMQSQITNLHNKIAELEAEIEALKLTI